MNLDEFEQAATRHFPKCGVTLLLESAGNTQREKLEAAIAAPHIQHAAIVKVAKQWGLPAVPSPGTVGRHRRGECTCQT